MKKSEFRGLSQVFQFTFFQAIKQKSYYVSLLIMIIFAIGVFPVMAFLNKDASDTVSENITDVSSDRAEIDKVEKIYFINNSSILDLDVNKLLSEETLKKVKIENASENLKKQCDVIVGKNENAIVVDLEMNMEEGCYKFNAYFDPEGQISENEADSIVSEMISEFSEYRVEKANIDKKVLEDINREISVSSKDYNEFTSKKEVTVITQNSYNVVYVVLMIMYMVIVMSANLVSAKIVEEKANRIVEYLMTTVRPMALMLGKILAMLLATVGEFVLIIVAGAISNQVTISVMGKTSMETIGQIVSFDVLSKMNIASVIYCIFVMSIGILIYSLIAGLFGASVSKTEDAQQGLKYFTFLILGSFIIVVVAANMMWSVGINGFVKFTMFLPFTSVLILPGVVLVGEASIITIAVSTVLMMLTAIVLLWFISLVYESVIVANGSPISFKTMIKIAKGSINKGKGV